MEFLIIGHFLIFFLVFYSFEKDLQVIIEQYVKPNLNANDGLFGQIKVMLIQHILNLDGHLNFSNFKKMA